MLANPRYQHAAEAVPGNENAVCSYGPVLLQQRHRFQGVRYRFLLNRKIINVFRESGCILPCSLLIAQDDDRF